MASPRGFSAVVTYVVYAAPDKVFDALTQEGLIGEWCENGGFVEPAAEGKFRLFGEWVTGGVVKYNKKKGQLAYTWKVAEWDQKTPASLVDYTFRPHPAGTEVVVEHTNLPSQQEADKHAAGWVDYVFEPLNDFFTR
jgi:uncharacterized protein YndB with AHSA1/START domain